MKKEQKYPIRVLQCVSNMDRAGIETILMNFYRNIDRQKVQFDFLVNKAKPGDYDEEIRKLGGNIILSPGLNPLKFFKYQKFMKNLFENHPEYKIIHCQNEAMGYYALKAAKDNNIPYRISHSHNTTIRKDLKFLIKTFCKSQLKKVANIKVACGEDAGKFMFGDDFKIIKNAIDIEKFIYNRKIREEYRKKLNIKDEYLIGIVARFEPQKNHEYLIEVFDALTKDNKDYKLLLIGTGSLEEKIKEKVKLLNLEDKVIFLGSVSNVNDYYQAMDCFVLTSFHEGLPVVGIEAQVSGLPCVFSSNITKEVQINDNVKYIDLDKTHLWVNSIKEACKNPRETKLDKIKNSGYDIKNASKELQKWYLDMYNGVLK